MIHIHVLNVDIKKMSYVEWMFLLVSTFYVSHKKGRKTEEEKAFIGNNIKHGKHANDNARTNSITGNVILNKKIFMKGESLLKKTL